MITEKYDNFIWDFDGTLFDSYPHTAAALAKALADTGRVIDVKEAEKLLFSITIYKYCLKFCILLLYVKF